MEVDDGRVQRDRALAAMTLAEDVEDRRALWRCAVRFNMKRRGGHLGLEFQTPAPGRARSLGESEVGDARNV